MATDPRPSAALLLDREGVSLRQEANRPGDATNAPGHDTEGGSSMPDNLTARNARNAHRTFVDVAPERVGKPYENGKRLTDIFQYRCHCICGWVGPTMATAGEARATGSVHRADKIRDALGV